jgi:hypothetical protein
MATAGEDSDALAREALIAQLKELTPSDFASRHLLDRVPWLFNDRHQYIDWKANLATELEVDGGLKRSKQFRPVESRLPEAIALRTLRSAYGNRV